VVVTCGAVCTVPTCGMWVYVCGRYLYVGCRQVFGGGGRRRQQVRKTNGTGRVNGWI